MCQIVENDKKLRGHAASNRFEDSSIDFVFIK